MMSPKEYVTKSVAQHPSLYYTGNFEDSAIRIYDHIFNTIGNGFRNVGDLKKELEADVNRKQDLDFYFSNQTLYQGYLKTENRFGREFPDHSSQVPGLYLESDKPKFPEVVYWWKHEPETDVRAPYPNFKKEYSLVWKRGFETLGIEWIDASIWYYEWCVDYFNQDLIAYSRAYPTNDPKADKRTLEDWKKSLACCESNEAISIAYGQEFTGDVEAFIVTRWKNEKKRIQEFLAETLERLHTMRKSVV